MGRYGANEIEQTKNSKFCAKKFYPRWAAMFEYLESIGLFRRSRVASIDHLSEIAK